MHLDHVTFRTDDLEGTKAFFTDVLGLAVGDRPPFDFPGYWLYGGARESAQGDDKALVHLVAATPDRSPLEGHGGGLDDAGTGTLDHIAFRGDDHDGLIRRLRDHGLEFTERTVPGRAVRQVFVKGPHNLIVEIAFPAGD